MPPLLRGPAFLQALSVAPVIAVGDAFRGRRSYLDWACWLGGRVLDACWQGRRRRCCNGASSRRAAVAFLFAAVVKLSIIEWNHIIF